MSPNPGRGDAVRIHLRGYKVVKDVNEENKYHKFLLIDVNSYTVSLDR